MAIPKFSLLSQEFPDYWKYPQPEDVKKMIGGGVNSKDIKNTCTSRLSHAMNGTDVPIPAKWEKIVSRRGKNGQFYLIRVVNFRPWMEFQFGKPDFDFPKEAGGAFDRSRIEGREGVIGFDIGFGNPTGHFDLCYRETFSHEDSAGKDYFKLATRVSLWSTGTRVIRAPV